MEYQTLDVEDTVVDTDFESAEALESEEIERAAAGTETGPADATLGTKRKYSFVWKYFRAVEGTNTFECLVCNGCVGNQTSNLARHLASSHDITKQRVQGINSPVRGRPSRSFIWKYCTKEDSKHARCHLCNKQLYFGGGNTANITKHLRRMHSHLIENKDERAAMDDETMQATASLNDTAFDEEFNGRTSTDASCNYVEDSKQGERKERKGASYVWNFCEKLSRHTIRCKLCTKVMSFHGTANVITHLQRRHNIVGKVEADTSLFNDGNAESSVSNVKEEDESMQEVEGDAESKGRRGRRSLGSSSIVWKYCTRISQDTVCCGFCKKNLSYQGTSNLQRHLHRMHGVTTHGRLTKSVEELRLSEGSYKLPTNTDFVWQFCTALEEEDKTKCNMCDAVFNVKEVETIAKHFAVVHSVETQGPSSLTKIKTRRRSRRHTLDYDTSEDGMDEEDYGVDKWSKIDESEENIPEIDENNIKKDDSLYNDIIVEEHDQINYDEEPFNPSVMHDMPQANPLSPQSSRGASPDHYTYLGQKPLIANSKRLQKLHEDRVRMETEYFREKAGYYRMQKYLTALQAKKVRIELERLSNVDTNVTQTDLNGAYAVEVSLPQHFSTQ